MIAIEEIEYLLRTGTPGAVRAARLTAMSQLSQMGYSGRRALDWLRKFSTTARPQGLGVRTQTFYEYWTPMRNYAENEGSVSALRPNQYPGRATSTVTPFNQVRNWNYLVAVAGADRESGEMGAVRITVASDVHLTIAQIEKWAIDIVQSSDAMCDFTGELVASVSNVWRRPGALR